MKIRVWFKLVIMTVLLSSFSKVWAINCYVEEGSPNQALYANFGTVTVSNDAAIGSVIAEKTLIGNTFKFACDAAVNYVDNVKLPILDSGQHIYNSGVQGVGLRIWALGGAGQEVYLMPRAPVSVGASEGYTSFKIELVKMGDITPGYLTTSPGYIADGEVQGYFAVAEIFLTGGQIVLPTCSVKSQNINVPLGTWNTSDLTGIGTKTSDVAVGLAFNCPSTGVSINAKVSATADPSIPGTILLTPGSTTATGVGIQMVDDSGTPLELNKSFVITNSANSGTYNPGWKAHYVQTGPAVSPGSANATVTVSFNYN